MWLFSRQSRAGNAMVKVQTEDFDVGAQIAALHEHDARVGAVASFVGTVRDMNEGSQVSTLTLEHYPGMTEKSLQEIVEQAQSKFDIYAATVIHRYGELRPCDRIVLVAVSSAHRGESFKACEFIMDYLKTQAPFWKKEQTPQGGRWVDARDSDAQALNRWRAE
jgi:molybdopterin synthase catalytic subunit